MEGAGREEGREKEAEEGLAVPGNWAEERAGLEAGDSAEGCNCFCSRPRGHGSQLEFAKSRGETEHHCTGQSQMRQPSNNMASTEVNRPWWRWRRWERRRRRR